MRPRILTFALFAVVLLPACGKKDEGSSSSSSSSGGSSSAAASDNPAGLDASKDLSPELKKLMESCLGWSKTDSNRLSAALKSFVLPNHATQFKKMFGDTMGAEWAGKYEKLLGEFDTKFKGLFEKMQADGNTNVTAIHLTAADTGASTGLQKEAFAAMPQPVALYTVKFIKPGEELGTSVWSWVYVDGGFRFLGKN